MLSQEYYLLEYALQKLDLHPVGCEGMTIHPLSAAIKSKQRFYQRQSLAQPCSPQGLGYLVTASTQE